MRVLILFFTFLSFPLYSSLSVGQFDDRTQSLVYTTLSSDVSQEIKFKNRWLNESVYFSKDAQSVVSKEAEPISFYGAVGAKLEGFVFKRNSQELIIVVPPFGASLDQQIRFAGIFKEYDVIVCACQWSDSTHTQKQFFNFLTSPLTMVFDDTIQAVINACQWAREQGYEKVHALGSCYGGILTAASQKKMKNNQLQGFDSLMLDSTPLSLSSVLKIALEDPYGVLKKGKVQTFASYTRMIRTLRIASVAKYISEFFLKEYTMSCLLKESEVPLLLMYGTDDLLVPEAQWKDFLKDNATSQMTVVVTPTKHLYASLKEKELYREITQRFLNNELL